MTSADASNSFLIHLKPFYFRDYYAKDTSNIITRIITPLSFLERYKCTLLNFTGPFMVSADASNSFLVHLNLSPTAALLVMHLGLLSKLQSPL